MIIISSLPTLLCGFLLIKLDLIDNLRNIKIIGWTTLVFAFLLYLSDLSPTKNKISSDFNLKSALIIGLLQIFALVPGVSRSGITISVSRFLEFERSEAAKISFWLSIPTLGSIGIYNMQKLITTNNITITMDNYFAIIMSFIFSLITIKYFIKYLKKFTLLLFVFYRIILGTIILIYVY